MPHYVFSAVPIASPIARAIVEGEMAALNIDDERRFGVLVALGEAIANAVEHAYRGELMHAFMDSVQILSTRESTKLVLKAKLSA